MSGTQHDVSVTKDEGKLKKRRINLYIDDWIAGMWGSFLISVLISFMLTKYGHPDAFKEPTILKWWAGSTNMCILMDYPPSTYVFPTLYNFMLLCWVVMEFLKLIRETETYVAGKIGRVRYTIMIGCIIYETLGAMFFSTSFAVQPDIKELKEGKPISMVMHTVPYINFIGVLSSVAVSNLIYDLSTGWSSFRGFREENTASRWWYLMILYPVAVVLTSAFKVVTLINAFSRSPTPAVPYHLLGVTNETLAYQYPCLESDYPNDPTCGGLWFCSNCDSVATIVIIIDRIWLVLVLALPFLKSIIFAIFFRNRVFRFGITIQPQFYVPQDGPSAFGGKDIPSTKDDKFVLM